MIVVGIVLLVLGVVLVFLLEHEVLDISYLLEEILTHIAVACALLGFILTVLSLTLQLVLSTPPEDIKSTEYSTNVQSEQNHCSLLGHSCIVEEWSPVCLIQECIIDARK